MQAPNATSQYHSLTFESIDEAAAFVAALSRFLNSPCTSIKPEDIEVWSFFSPPHVHIHLSEAAKIAAALAFAPLPPSRSCRREEFAPASRLLLSSSHLPAWGSGQAELAILAP